MNIAHCITHVTKRGERWPRFIPPEGAKCDPNVIFGYLCGIRFCNFVEPPRQKIGRIFLNALQTLNDRYFEFLALERIKSKPKVISDQILKSINADALRGLCLAHLDLPGERVPGTPNVKRRARHCPCASCQQKPGSQDQA